MLLGRFYYILISIRYSLNHKSKEKFAYENDT